MNKKILYILSNKFSNIDKLLSLVNSSYINIAVDGGLEIAKKYRFLDKLSFAIGDFDTCKSPEKIIKIEKIIRFPSEKDDADTILAYKYAVSKDKDQLSDLFRKNKRWTQLVYQIAGVNCVQLGRKKEGRNLIWKGYFSNPKHLKSLFRAIKYSL
ncbi:MAG TPA: hypothetical protein PKH20_01830 [Exilispira sp.]|nr:hypothetical protein [Exilispira sp.]